MSNPTNFRFKFCDTLNVVDYCYLSSPVQTISEGANWVSESDVQTISKSSSYSSAIKTDGTLWLWGNNSTGQLGNNLKLDQCSPVQTIACGTDWKQVSLGNSHSAAIKTDGTLWLWGQNCAAFACDGLLGDNSTISKSSPVQTIACGTNWKQVSLGRWHSGAIKTDGTLWLWGSGDCGQLGNDNTNRQRSPVQTIACGTNWSQVSLGDCHSAAIKTDGTLWLWGQNGSSGELGINDIGIGTCRSSPVQTISCGTNWKQVSLGSNYSAAIKTDGSLWLWGDNTRGQLGNGIGSSSYSSPIQTISQGLNWKQIGIGLGVCYSAAIKTDGTLWLWGSNQGSAKRYGTLGNNSTIDESSPVQTISCGTNWKQVSGSSSIKTDGTLWLWGENGIGQIGNGLCSSIDGISSPVQTISATRTWVPIDDITLSAGLGHSASIKTDGTLWLWGCNLDGQLGTNSTINQSSPVQTIACGTNWCQVSLGSIHSAAIKTDGTLWLWGEGKGLGTNSQTNQSSPVQTIACGTNWKQISLGLSNSAAIKTDGTLWLWGFNGCGELGTNSLTDVSSPVQTIACGTNWKQVSISTRFTAAIKTDGTLWAWGHGSAGRLGNNSTINQSSPVQTVSTGTNWKQVSLGNAHTSAVKTDGTLWLWGYGGNGILGTNNSINQSSPVQTVSTGTNWKSSYLNNSSTHSVAIKTDGTLWTWGYNFCGQLGNNSTIDQSSPVQTIATNIYWNNASAGGCFTLAADFSGKLYGFGRNASGELGYGLQRIDGSSVCADFDDMFVRRDIFSQGGLWGWGTGSTGTLGNNSTLNQSSPIQTVSGGSNWKQTSANQSASSSIKTDGTLWLWGDGNSGLLGNNSTINRSSPVQTVSTGTNWRQVSVGTGQVASIKTDGTLWLWGSNGTGKLGNNSTIDRSSPVQTIACGTNWKQAALGTSYSAAIKTDGTLWLWGANGGVLGNNNTIGVSSPIQTISTSTNWKQVCLGTNHSAAIKTDGTLWLWGSGTNGLLGNNNTINVSSPIQTISTGTNWIDIALACDRSFGIREDCY